MYISSKRMLIPLFLIVICMTSLLILKFTMTMDKDFKSIYRKEKDVETLSEIIIEERENKNDIGSKGSIALIIHCGFSEFEIVRLGMELLYFKGYSLHLFMTTWGEGDIFWQRHGSYIESICETVTYKSWKENPGTDVNPMVHMYEQTRKCGADIVIKTHTKSNYMWLSDMSILLFLDIDTIYHKLTSDKKLGMAWRQHGLKYNKRNDRNTYWCDLLMDNLRLRISDEPTSFPVGTIFAMRKDVMDEIMTKKLVEFIKKNEVLPGKGLNHKWYATHVSSLSPEMDNEDIQTHYDKYGRGKYLEHFKDTPDGRFNLSDASIEHGMERLFGLAPQEIGWKPYFL
jgi:hypothetical protein